MKTELTDRSLVDKFGFPKESISVKQILGVENCLSFAPIHAVGQGHLVVLRILNSAKENNRPGDRMYIRGQHFLIAVMLCHTKSPEPRKTNLSRVSKAHP